MENKIGLFFGSDTGFTENVAKMIAQKIGEDHVDLYNIRQVGSEEMIRYDKLILGLSTWHDGEMQTDWEEFYSDLKNIDFQGKTVALFGLGDQVSYGDYFIDGIGTVGEVITDNGGKIIGAWPAEDYDHDDSLAEVEEGKFIGLAIDEENQPDLTEERVDAWVKQIKKEFQI